jgi:ribulose-phosphate 3-epimerase
MSSEPYIKIAPSILSADFGRLTEEVQEGVRAGADYIHVDIMDGHFVPNITFGWTMVDVIKKAAGEVALDLHLMISNPDAYLKNFVESGADILTVHIEACSHIQRTLTQIRNLGAKSGVALNPGTPISSIENVLEDLDLLLLMTVNPGFGGQSYIASVETKITRARKLLKDGDYQSELEVDGGITQKTAPRAVHAGATVLVAGSAIYGSQGNPTLNIQKLRGSIQKGEAS